MAVAVHQHAENEWVTLPGGELEGRRPRTLCGPCRVRKAAGAAPRAICFECFRADRKRQAGLGAALKTASEFESTREGIVARFQNGLPFEPVNLPRLQQLKAERAAARRQASAGAGQYVDKRRQAQIAARHALQRLGEGLKTQGMHAAELQLPEAWLPFVASR
jgi:hypothetical protein